MEATGAGGAGGAGPETCDPLIEYNRRYVGTGDECGVLDFDCTAPTTGFSNDCGCGCEQEASCRQHYFCGTPGECDQYVFSHCPYSTYHQ
jgi:hypothetical protein